MMSAWVGMALSEEDFHKFFSFKAEMLSNVREDSGQGAGFQRIVSGNGDMVFARLLSRHADVAAFLASDFVAKFF